MARTISVARHKARVEQHQAQLQEERQRQREARQVVLAKHRQRDVAVYKLAERIYRVARDEEQYSCPQLFTACVFEAQAALKTDDGVFSEDQVRQLRDKISSEWELHAQFGPPKWHHP